MRAQIRDDAGEEALALHLEFANREVDRKYRPVLALARNFAADADDPLLTRLDIPLHVVVVLRAVRLRHQHADVAIEHLFRRIAEHALGRGVDRPHSPAIIDSQDRHDGGFEKRLQHRPAFSFISRIG